MPRALNVRSVCRTVKRAQRDRQAADADNPVLGGAVGAGAGGQRQQVGFGKLMCFEDLWMELDLKSRAWAWDQALLERECSGSRWVSCVCVASLSVEAQSSVSSKAALVLQGEDSGSRWVRAC